MEAEESSKIIGEKASRTATRESSGSSHRWLLLPLRRKPSPVIEQNDPDNLLLSSIFPLFNGEGNGNDQDRAFFAWYESWVRRQLNNQAACLVTTAGGQDQALSSEGWSCFKKIWTETARFINNEYPTSIDEIVQHIHRMKTDTLMEFDGCLNIDRLLVFAIMGWQTMLYRPDIGSAPPALLSIEDDLDGYKCSTRLALKQRDSLCKRPLQELLLGFGILLPPRNFNPLETTEPKAFRDCKTIDPAWLNASVITDIGKLSIKWVDSLPCHLELDKATKTLYLFQYPSFCIANIRTEGSEKKQKGPLQSCALPQSDSGKTWASEEDVDQLLRETLTTYRLLFGQTKAGRRVYRQIDSDKVIDAYESDPVLSEICGRKTTPFVEWCEERDLYHVAQDFPIYRAKLAVLQQYLLDMRPRTWTELWKDRRDSAQWLTFWVVIIIGGIGVLLAFVQVILQIVQIVVT